MKKLQLFALLVAASACAATACDDGQRSKGINDAMTLTKHEIINGVSDNIESHSAVVSLYDSNAKYSYCTGTLIHPQWVLTAAHCVTDTDEYTGAISMSPYNRYMRIGFGKSEAAVAKNLYPIAGTSQIYYHSTYGDYQYDYNYGTLRGDIALIKLKNPVPSSVAKPILPQPKWLPLRSADLPVDMTFVGFGINETGGSGKKLMITGAVTDYCGAGNSTDKTTGCKLKSSTRSYVTVSGCHPDVENYGCVDTPARDYIFLPYGGIYYNQANINGGPCQGDSGGPAFLTKGGVEYVSGVTSYGDGVCGYYGVSTAVQDYYDWIISIAPEVATQYTEVCGNGLDDDNDGLIDSKDSDCPVETCGNNKLDPGEECDGTALPIASALCSDYDSVRFGSGSIKCNAKCQVDTNACTKIEICYDGIDNDGDGRIDCKDRDCDFSTSCVEICDDGIDNDGDGYTDCRDNYCSNDRACKVLPEVCDDNYDNDHDGKTDCDDSDCAKDPACYVAPTPEPEICNDGIDNDLDGDTDCSDSDCIADPSCQSASGGSQGDSTEICDDHIDNDHNGKADCDDEACIHTIACAQIIWSESEFCGDGIVNGDEECDGNAYLFDESTCKGWDPKTPLGSIACNADCTVNLDACHSPEICGNGIDDDGDGFIDCYDADCAWQISECPLKPEICGNNFDDDANGLSDCDDPACATHESCKKQEICGNGIDDNGDGDIDCDDLACFQLTECGITDIELCDNNIDDDGDGYVDCHDPECIYSVACLNSSTANLNIICSNGIDDDKNGKTDCADKAVCASAPVCLDKMRNTENSSSSCSATPLSSSNAPLGFALFGLLGLLGLRRRTRQN